MADYIIDVLKCDLFDTRLTQRHLEKSLLEPHQVQAHHDQLPDLAEDVEEFVVHLGAPPADAEAEL